MGTKKADIAEAVLEGICYEMKDILQMNEELAGEIKHVRLTGGVLRSELWCQMFADILRKPVELTDTTELGCLGAAICAGVGGGVFETLEQGIEKCVHIARVYEPNEKKAKKYDEVFKEWSRLYDIVNEQVY